MLLAVNAAVTRVRRLAAHRRAWAVRGAIFVVLAQAALLGIPGAVFAHDISNAAGHEAEDSVVHSAAMEARLNNGTLIRSAWAAQATAAAVAADPGQVGQWGPVVNWPVVGVHVALLPNGKVLAYDSVGDAATETFPVHDFTRATVYDPVTGSQTPATVDTGYNIFCSGFAHLADGSLFIAGGNKNAQLEGIVKTHLFNPVTNAWSLGPDMAAGRWYPSVTPLTNGEMLITEGGPDTPEVRRTDATLRTLNTATLNLPLYPWMDVAPDGRVFYAGPDQTLRKLNTAGGGSWQTFSQRDGINRTYGSHAVYDIGKTLVAGGGASTKTALVIDTNGATPTLTATSPMAFGRRQFNLTLLADGSVLATGGNSTGASLVDMNGGVYNAERWDPATGQWTTLAAQAVTRQYHSTALLLPDGRVLSSGGGICGTCDQVGYLAKNAEVFTPPYLFKKDGSGQLASRPEITGAPATVNHGTSFQITTASAASIRKVGMMRLGSQTHSVEMEQHYVPLSFTAGAGTLTATVPANAHAAVPGVYMLFIVDSAGVPSVARIVAVASAGDTTPPTVAGVTPASGATGVAAGTNVVATFSEPIAPASVTSSTFVLRDGGGAIVTASVSASGSTATLDPTGTLSPSTTYTATLSGGPSGIKDLAGNALAANFSWSFTTAAPDTTPPTVSSVSPLSGATGVAAGSNVTATFSEPIAAASVTSSTFVLRDPGGATVAAAVSVLGSTAMLDPTGTLSSSTTYTATLSGGASGIKDVAGNALAANFSWSFTTAAPSACPCSIWAPNATPQTAAADDSTAYELGVRFKSDVAGFITGIRFYKGSGNTGTHVAHLWSASGTQLAAATFAGETATGWQEVSFASPVAIAANTAYIASYYAPAGHFALDRPYFTSAFNNVPLHALADGDGGPNGVYNVGTGFPSSTFQSSNYWVDVVLSTGATDTTPPTVASVTPASGATGVAAGSNVSATFSEPIAAASVTSSTFVLRDPGGATVAAAVAASGSTATLDPTGTLAPSTTYTATLSGGASGIKDLAGNALAANFSWSFTTADTTPPTVSSVSPV